MDFSRKKVLLIEDDVDISGLIELQLIEAGITVVPAFDGEAGLNKFGQAKYDLVILDLMLPKIDGLEVCRTIRKDAHWTPILMLTARSDEFDKVLGLELGADDYLTKPFSTRELTARVKAIMRRADAMNQPAESDNVQTLEVITAGRLTIELKKHRVMVDGESVSLTAKEFDMLKVLALNPGRVYSREELLNIVWEYQFDGYEHTVNSHMNRLRSKIEPDPANPIYIKTIWGVGYRFVEADEL